MSILDEIEKELQDKFNIKVIAEERNDLLHD